MIQLTGGLQSSSYWQAVRASAADNPQQTVGAWDVTLRPKTPPDQDLIPQAALDDAPDPEELWYVATNFARKRIEIGVHVENLNEDPKHCADRVVEIVCTADEHLTGDADLADDADFHDPGGEG